MLHIASYPCYLFYLLKCTYIILSRLFSTCHWRMNMCYLIGLRIHMLILFTRSLTKEQLNAKWEYGKMLWHSSCEKTTIEWLSFYTIHGTQFLFYSSNSFFWFYRSWILQFFKNFLNCINIMWDLFVQNARGSKC